MQNWKQNAWKYYMIFEGQVWWGMPVNPSPGRLRQVNISLGYTIKPGL